MASPSSPRWPRARAALAKPSIVVIAAALGVVVFAQALFLGFQADDLWHQIFLARAPRWAPGLVPSPFALFTFYDGDPARTMWLVDQGTAPWWTEPTVHIAFLRPVTSVTHLVDHALAPGSAVFAHAHSLLWYGALVAAVAALYRRALGATWVAGLAAVFYAVDYNHGVIATWIANRSALVSGALGVGAVVFFVHARREGKRLSHALSALLLAGSLFAGEPGVGACGWLAAWALTMDEGKLRERVARLWPQMAVAVVWAAVYRAGHWGARGSAVYLDPFREPLAYAAGLFEKVPLLVAADLGAPGPDVVMFGERWPQLALLAVSALITLVAVVVLVPFVRADRASRFFALGTALSLVPACATFASVRMLTLPGIGIVGLVAQLVAVGVDRAPPLPAEGLRRRLTLGLALFTGASHAFFAPVVSQASSRQLWFLERLVHRWSDPIDDAGLAQARLMVVNAPAIPFIGYLGPRRWVDGRAVPRAMLPMGLGARDMDLERLDERTLLARQDQGYALTDLEMLTAPRSRRWSVGERVELSGARIEVRETTPDGRPLTVAFRFDVPLEDASLRWTKWDGRGLVPFAPPPVGGKASIRGQALSPF